VINWKPEGMEKEKREREAVPKEPGKMGYIQL